MERTPDNEKPSAQLFKKELYRDLDRSPARLEMERRRLVARIGSGESPIGERRRWIPALSLGLATAAAVAAVLVFAPWQSTVSRDSVSISGLWMVQPTDAVAHGRQVSVPPGAGAKIVLEDETTLWLDEATLISTSGGGGPVDHFELKSGRLLARVTPRSGDRFFTVDTPHGAIVVHGTVFSVNVNQSSAEVRLHEGEVEVIGASENVTIAPGHRLEFARGTAVAAGPIDPTGVIEDLMITEETASLAGPAVPDIAVAQPMSTAPRISNIRAIVAPASVEPVPTEEQPQVEKPARPTPKRRPDAEPVDKPSSEEADPELAPAPFVDPAIEDIEVTTGTLPADEALFLEAYTEVTHGNHATGKKLLREYLATHPEGRYWQRVREILGE